MEWNIFGGRDLLTPERHGVEIARIILRLYFGIVGCIVPVGCIPEFYEDFFAFTLAGPCDAAGKKEFYAMVYSLPLEATCLSRFSPGFSSVADFHLNCSKVKRKYIEPVEGGKEATMARFEEVGFYTETFLDVERNRASLMEWASVDPELDISEFAL